jgi:Zn-finger domain-containing protein
MNYKVSKQTAELIKAYDMTNGIYKYAYDSMCKIYAEDKALAIIEEHFTPGLKALEDAIFKLVAISMKERRGYINSNEV